MPWNFWSGELFELDVEQPDRKSIRSSTGELQRFARRVTVGIYEPAARLVGVSMFLFMILVFSGLFVFALLFAGYLMDELTPSTVHLSVPALVVGYLLGEFREWIQEEVTEMFRVIRKGISEKSSPSTDVSLGDFLLFTFMSSIFVLTFSGAREWTARVLDDHSLLEALTIPEIGFLRVIVALCLELAGNAILIAAVAALVMVGTMPMVYLSEVDWDHERTLTWKVVTLRVAGIATAVAVVAGGIAAFAWFAGMRAYPPPGRVEVFASVTVLLVAGLAIRILVDLLALVAILGYAVALRGIAQAVLFGARFAPRPTRAIYRAGERIVAGGRWTASQGRRAGRRARSSVDGAFLPIASTVVAFVGFVFARVAASNLTHGYVGTGGLDSFEPPVTIDPVVLALDAAGIAALTAGACSGSVAAIRLRERGVHETARSWREAVVNRIRRVYRFGAYFAGPLAGRTKQVSGYGDWLRMCIPLQALGVVGHAGESDPITVSVDGYPIVENTVPFGLTPTVGLQLLLLGFVGSLALAILDQHARERPRYWLTAIVALPVVGPYCYLFYYRHVAGPRASEPAPDDEPERRAKGE